MTEAMVGRKKHNLTFHAQLGIITVAVLAVANVPMITTTDHTLPASLHIVALAESRNQSVPATAER